MPHPRRIIQVRQWTHSFGRRAWRLGVGAIPGSPMAASGCLASDQRGAAPIVTKSPPCCEHDRVVLRAGLDAKRHHDVVASSGVCRRSLPSGVVDIY
jgi:hypothetical protein